MQVIELVEQCNRALEILSGYGGDPDLKMATKEIKSLNRQINALDNRISKVLSYFSGFSLGLMGSAKRRIANAETAITGGRAYDARQHLFSARDTLTTLHETLKKALT